MKVTYPYETEINTKEDAARYIRNQCNDCPKYNGAHECSGAVTVKCQESVNMVMAEFAKINN